jgi:hypothetical protein
LTINLIYRSPNSNNENLDKLCNVLENSKENEFNLFIGDFNMPDIDWKNYQSKNSKYSRFLSIINQKSFHQLIDFPTHSKGNILDIVLTNNPDCILNIESFGNLSNSDHCIISIDVLSKYDNNDECDLMLNWNKADINGLKNHFINSNIEANITNLNVSDSWTLFKNVIHDGIEKYVPKCKRRNCNRPVWMNRHVIRLTRQKRRRFKEYCKNRTDENLKIYKKIEKLCKKSVRSSKRKFEKKISNDTNQKRFNSYVRSKTKQKTGVGPLVINGKIVNDNLTIAKILIEQFSSVFTKESTQGQSFDIPVRGNILGLDNLSVTPAMVKDKVINWKKTGSCGPDKITSYILQTFQSELIIPLTVIYNKSLSSGEVPTDWKLGNVTPIFKKGSKRDPTKYRPISQTSVPCKILESLIKDKIVEHLETFNLILPTQHGFTKGRSCTTNLLEFSENLVGCLDSNIPVDVVYLDFSKAFDKVPISKLLAKVKALNISGNLYNWIKSWLNDRKQRVVLNGVESEWCIVFSGVPQGSVLGPLLFLIYINDIDNAVTLIKFFSKFADDTKVGHPVQSVEDRDLLQSQLDSLYKWSQDWGMEFNVDKCKVLHYGKKNHEYSYTMNGTEMEKVDTEKDVGVLVNKTGKPSEQCTKASRTANGILSQISKAFHYRDRHNFLKLYKSQVRVHLEYATPAWSPWQVGDCEVLEKVQKRAVNMISGLSGSYEEKLNVLNIEKLSTRRFRADMIETYKILNNIAKVDPDIWFTRSNPGRAQTRSTVDNPELNLVLPHKNTELGKNSFSVRSVRGWNSLPGEIKTSRNLSQFKRRLDKHIKNT